MQTIDIVPTIADLIGVDIPWEVDGLAAGSEAQRDRDDTKLLRQFPEPRRLPTRSRPPTSTARRGFAEMLDHAFPPLDPDDPLRPLYDLSGYGELVGSRSSPPARSPATPSRSTISTELLRTFEVPIVLTGTVAGGRVDEDAVAAVADGGSWRCRRSCHRNIGGPAFALLLPLDGSAGLGEVRLALVRGSELLDGGEIVD